MCAALLSHAHRTSPLVAGAVKAAAGHAEPAAGVLGILAAKAALEGRRLHSSTFQLNLSRFCH